MRDKATESLVDDLLRQGLPNAEIAAMVGMHRSTINDRRNKLGLPPAKPKRGPNPNAGANRQYDHEPLQALARQGLSASQIADRTDVPLGTVLYACRGLLQGKGKPRRVCHQYTAEQVAELVGCGVEIVQREADRLQMAEPFTGRQMHRLKELATVRRRKND